MANSTRRHATSLVSWATYFSCLN